MQESKLRNLDHGDLDSLGLFQQRPSQGWGTASQIMVPRYAALYRGGAYPTKDYERELEERIRRVRARYEFRERPARPARLAESETVQLQLAI